MLKGTKFIWATLILFLFIAGTVFSQTSIEVTPDQGLRTAIEYAAQTGIDTIYLATSGGVYTETDTLNFQISSPIVIMAKPGLDEKPIITNSDSTHKFLEIFRVSNSLTLDGVVLDGGYVDPNGVISSPGMKYALRVGESVVDASPAAAGLNLIVKNCDFKNFYDKGTGDGHAIYFLKDVPTVNKVLMENCTVNGTGYEAIRIAETEKYTTERALDTLIVRNTTFQNVDAECIRLYSDTDINTPDAYVLLEHLTLNHCNTRAFYIKNNKNVIVRDWIITNDYVGSHGRSDYTGQVQLEGSTISNMDLFNLTVSDVQATKGGTVDSATIYNFDPMFADSTNGDFTLLAGSEAYGKAHDGTALGDLRWATNPSVGVEDGKVIATTYKLSQNYPNPFNPTTTINFSLSKAGFVNVTIYNVLGEFVKTLVNENKNAGSYDVNFNAANLTSGVYFYTIRTNDFVQTKKMILMK